MDDYSIGLREHTVAVMLGLGLPIPALHRKELWGYDRDYEKHVYIPNDKQLNALDMAFKMADSGDYHTDDILPWLAEASGLSISRRNYFILKKDRPLFPEFTLSLEERINIFNGLSSPPASEKTRKAKNYRQAYNAQRAQGIGEGDGEAEGTPDSTDDSTN